MSNKGWSNVQHAMRLKDKRILELEAAEREVERLRKRVVALETRCWRKNDKREYQEERAEAAEAKLAKVVERLVATEKQWQREEYEMSRSTITVTDCIDDLQAIIKEARDDTL